MRKHIKAGRCVYYLYYQNLSYSWAVSPPLRLGAYENCAIRPARDGCGNHWCVNQNRIYMSRDKAEKHKRKLNRLLKRIEGRNRMDKQALKPCPFCGGEARIRPSFECWTVACKSCDAKTAPEKYKDRAIKAWNNRNGGQ